MSTNPHAMQISDRATCWKLRARTLDFPAMPLLMGIVNVTPDSFSDGGQFVDPDMAVEHALRLAEEGAAILDIGGESTRPYSEPVSADEEIRRVLPVVERLARQTDVPISIDTSKAAVAQAAVGAGAEVINDVTALTADPAMLPFAVQSGVGVCAMHMQGSPQTMQNEPTYGDVVGEVSEYLSRRRDALIAAGVDRDRICLDPGIGFGKTTAHNLALLANCCSLHKLGCPILVGHSRKGFLSKVIGDAYCDVAAGTIGVTLALAVQGIQIMRVHDIRPMREALILFAASGGLGSPMG